LAHLDLATVLKVSHTVSGEILLEKLVDTVLRTAIEHAGAERGLLLLSRGSELLVRAEGETRDSSVTVRLCETPVAATQLLESVVRYAARTRETVILADASAGDPYSTDEYIRATGVRSVLCLPLVKQGSLVALLYLENRLASNVFTPSRIALLEVLASQAAISLENSALYSERKRAQEEREKQRVRQLAREFELSLEARVAERTRIARELHDTLLQTFCGSLLHFQAAWDPFPTRPEEARQILGRAIDDAAKAIEEGREAVEGLRTSVSSEDEPDDLEAAIESFGKKLAADPSTNHAASLRVDLEGRVRPLDPNVRGEIYRIACEALRNAFQHSEATQIEVAFRYEEEQFRLRVRDDGKGMDAKVLADGRREGHYGLCGMRERADLIGAKLDLRGGPNAGTEVELTLAVSDAYLKTSCAASSRD
jgi:signal transduction histidine kinase